MRSLFVVREMPGATLVAGGFGRVQVLKGPAEALRTSAEEPPPGAREGRRRARAEAAAAARQAVVEDGLS